MNAHLAHADRPLPIACGDAADNALASSDVERRRLWMFALLLVLAGTLAYENSFAGMFHYDDFPCIVRNHSLKSLIGTWQATGDEIPGGLKRRPVGRWTFALNRTWHDLDPWGYHAVNLAIHLVNGLLILSLVRETLRLPGMRVDLQQHATGLAFCTALLWVVHPLQTESVTYIVQRLESLMATFFLATLFCLLQGATKKRRGWYVAAVVAAGLSLGTKEVALMIPPVALLYDRLFLAGSWRELIRQRGWVHGCLWVGAIAYVIMGIGRIPFYWDRPEVAAITGNSAGGRPSSWEFLRSQPGVLLHYLKLICWPQGQCLEYLWPIAHAPWEIYGQGGVIMGILLGGIALLRIYPRVAFLILSFFLVLAPSSTIVPLHLAFEHRVYLPLAALMAGFVLIVYTSLLWCWRTVPTRTSRAMAATLMLGCCLSIPWILVTRWRNEVYHSQLAMWQDVVRVRPENFRAHSDLGIFAAHAGKTALAAQHYAIALQLAPNYDVLQYNYGLFLVEHQQRIQEALPFLERAILLNPQHASYRFGYADVLEKIGRLSDAETAFRAGLDRDPSEPIAHLRLGQLLMKQRRYEEAERHLWRSAELAPYLWQPHRELGQIDLAQGNLAAAIAHYQFVIDDRRPRTPEVFLRELASLLEGWKAVQARKQEEVE